MERHSIATINEHLLDVPWRNMKSVNGVCEVFSEENERAIRKEMENQTNKDSHLKPNILMLGPSGSGKSSFINSVASVNKNKIAYVTHAGEWESSFTVRFRKYSPKSGFLKNFRLFDCMGLEQGEIGFNLKDAVNLVKGHIPINYEFDPKVPMDAASDDTFNTDPKAKDKMHCIVCVVDAVSLFGGLTEPIKERIIELLSKLKNMEIPRVLVLTKIDRLCPAVANDVKYVYSSKQVKNAVEKASSVFGIPENLIYPVKNYVKEVQIDRNMNVLILLALQNMMSFADDFFEVEEESADEN